MLSNDLTNLASMVGEAVAAGRGMSVRQMAVLEVVLRMAARDARALEDQAVPETAKLQTLPDGVVDLRDWVERRGGAA